MSDARQRALDEAIANVGRRWGEFVPIENRPQPGWVYVIATLDGGMVKVGYSSDPERRLTSLKSSCPLKLRIVMKHRSNPFAEKMLHERWEKRRLHGERYEGSPALWAELACRDFVMQPWADRPPRRSLARRCEKAPALGVTL